MKGILKIIIIGGILMISSFSYYGAVDDKGQKIISFEENAIQSNIAFQSKSVEEKQQEIKQEEHQELKIAEVEKNIPKQETKTANVVTEKPTKEDKKDAVPQKLSNTSKVEKTTEKIEVNKQQEDEIIQEKDNQQEVIEKTICTDNNHKTEVGNSNKWFDNQQNAIAEYKAELEKWSQKAKSGAIDYEELYQKCPYGYETWNCSNCDKWTLNYYYH